jgi:uncharacterized circularly permuted ATP-grasp superfamily protein
MFDEMRGNGSADEAVRPAYAALSEWLDEVKPDVLDFRRREAELLFRRIGITLRSTATRKRKSASFPSTSFHAFWPRPNGTFCAAAWSSASRPSTPT